VGDGHLAAMLERLERQLEASLSQIAPRTDNVGPDVDVHKQRIVDLLNHPVNHQSKIINQKRILNQRSPIKNGLIGSLNRLGHNEPSWERFSRAVSC
jgi:hypothetical protein